jgi:exodeoxyribonuclease III
MILKFLSWNVNGIRAAEKKGFTGWLSRENPFFLGVQETRVASEDLSEPLRSPQGYFSFWDFSRQKGYSGVASYFAEKPEKVSYGIGLQEFDIEGRTITAEFPRFTVINTYFPNGRSDEERLSFKMKFYKRYLEFLENLKKSKKPLIICGDFNTAHREIDLARPQANQKVSGFLPEERAFLDELVGLGMADTFRVFNKDPGNYTWWDMKTRARERNVGWRLDYFFVSESLLSSLKSAFILSDVYGSDHCPAGIVMDK